MTRTTILYYDGDRAYIAQMDDMGQVREIETCRIHPDRYIRIDDGRHYPQLCEGAGKSGATLIAHRDEEKIGPALARDCHARYFKTRSGYKRALARMRAEEAAYA